MIREKAEVMYTYNCSLDINKCFILYISNIKQFYAVVIRIKTTRRAMTTVFLLLTTNAKQDRHKKKREEKKKSSHIPVKCFVG